MGNVERQITGTPYEIGQKIAKHEVRLFTQDMKRLDPSADSSPSDEPPIDAGAYLTFRFSNQSFADNPEGYLQSLQELGRGYRHELEKNDTPNQTHYRTYVLNTQSKLFPGTEGDFNGNSLFDDLDQGILLANDFNLSGSTDLDEVLFVTDAHHTASINLPEEQKKQVQNILFHIYSSIDMGKSPGETYAAAAPNIIALFDSTPYTSQVKKYAKQIIQNQE